MVNIFYSTLQKKNAFYENIGNLTLTIFEMDIFSEDLHKSVQKTVKIIEL